MPLKFTTRPAERSTVVLDVEIPPDRLQRSIDEAVRHLGRRTRVPGFRPGKVPRPMLERALGVQRSDPTAPDPIYDDAKEHLYERSVVEALTDSELDVLEIPREPEWTSFQEGQGAAYRVTVPVRPSVQLGDYANFPFKPEVEVVDDPKVEAVLEQLRDQQAALVPVEDRAAQTGDFAVIRFEGRRGGEPVEGASAERFPLVIGNERMVPGFEDALIGMNEGEEKTFEVTFPDDYGEAELAGQAVEFQAAVLELRERRLPPLDEDLARSVGGFETLDELRADIRGRLELNALDRARHAFADRIIEYATANATEDVPDLLVDREVDVMVDELKVRLGEQRIGYDEYLRVTERDERKLREEYREGAEHRVKVLLVLGAIADAEGIEVPDSAVEAELERGRRSNPDSPRLIAYLESERGRSYLRSQLRRSMTVETLIDRWIEAHPEFKDVQHMEGREVASASAAEPEAAEPGEPEVEGPGEPEAAELGEPEAAELGEPEPADPSDVTSSPGAPEPSDATWSSGAPEPSDATTSSDEAAPVVASATDAPA